MGSYADSSEPGGRKSSDHVDVLFPVGEAERLRILESALHASANGVLICNRRGSIIWVNWAFTELTGYAAAEVLGKTPQVLKSGRHDRAFYQKLWETILAGSVWHGEIENRRKDGTVYPEEMTITPVRGARGEIENFIAIKQNIAARKAAESALAKSEIKFRNLANCLPEIVVETDIFGTPTFVNSNGHKLLYRNGGQTAEVRLNGLLAPGDHDRARADFQRFVAGQGNSQYEFKVLREDGSTFPILISPSLIVEDNQTVGVRAVAVDLSEREKAEDVLRLTQFATDNAADGIIWLDASGRILYVNDAICRMLGYARAELLSMTIYQVDPNVEPKSWRRNWEAGKESTVSFETYHRRKDGTKFPVHIKATQAEFRGKEYGFAFIRDITDSKLADAELGETKHLFQTLMAAIPDCIYFKDRDSRFLRISNTQAKLFGLIYPSQAVGKTDFDFFSQEHAQKAYEDEQEVISTGNSLVGVEEKETWPDGRETWASTTKARFCGQDGHVIGTFGISRDITTRKAAEEHLRASEEFTERVIESWTDGVGVVKADGKLLYLNTRGRELLGLDGDNDASQLTWLDFWEGSDRHKASDALQKATAGGIGAYQGSFRMATGAPKFWDVAITPISRANGEVERLVCVFRDITERRLLESQLAQAQKLESIGQLAAGIAHEINTPIQYIGDNGRFLEEAFQDMLRIIPLPGDVGASPPQENGVDIAYLRDEIPQAIHQLLEGVGHVAGIVRAMKEFSHPGGAEKGLVNINHAIESTALVSKNEWKYVADLRLELDPDLPLVPCFSGEINQVLLNLIVNSAQAIGETIKGGGGKGAIHITTRRNGCWAEIEVSDTGPGIPQEIQSKVFDPFFTTKPVGKGTGQGLAIAHSVIVQKHQGSISFDSSPSTGTRFVIRLPLATEVKTDETIAIRR
jgi:two-component system NtrC family sensor kinase